jgi:lambda family phage portal protein
MNFLNRAFLGTMNVVSGGALNSEVQRAYYEGAKSTRLNRDFNIANNHFELQGGTDRDKLRSRARWLKANNPITKSIDKSITKNVVGTGITFQSKIKKDLVPTADKLNNEIERLWSQFIKKQNIDTTGRFNIFKMQDIILNTKMVDGEQLINIMYHSDGEFPISFSLVESDQFDTMKTKEGKNQVFSGVEINNLGRPVAYHLKPDINSFSSLRFDQKNIIHFYEADRSTQYRGISEYAQTINNLKDFAAYNDSEIVKNRILSSFGLFIKTTDIGKNLFADKKTAQKQGEKEPIKEITAGMVKYLRAGESVETVQSNQLGNAYKDFVSNTIRLIAAGRDISYELAFRDYTKTNFSSARASLIQDNRRFDIEQLYLINDVFNPMYEAWLDACVLSKKIKMPNDYWANKWKYIAPAWTPPKREWVDPLKDIKAIKEEIGLNINSKRRAAASRGVDVEDIIDEEIAVEKMIAEKRKAAGLKEEEEE